MWTDSIKVVAKLDSIRKKQAEREGGVVAPGRKNKRARADDLLDSLASIQEQQRYQAQLLNTLLVKMNTTEHSTLTSPVSSPPHSPCNSIVASPPRSPSSVVAVSGASSNNDTLEAAFYNFLQVYHAVDVDERPRKIRKLMDTMDVDKKKEIKEIGCVLADFTDTQSSSEESVNEQETFEQVSTSLNQPSFSSSSLSLSSEMRSFLGEEDVDFVDSSIVPSEPSEADLQNWNSLLHDYLTKDL